MNKKLLPISKHSYNKARISPSEVMTIQILYHLSGYKCFEYFYTQAALKFLKVYFPMLPFYNRFVELQGRNWHYLFAFVNTVRTGEETGVFIVDSKHLKVCHNRRIKSHKVFDSIAQRGKTSTGWFYGMKLFLVINSQGEIMRASMTSGNIADNNFDHLLCLF